MRMLSLIALAKIDLFVMMYEKVQEYLNIVPERFEYVFTLKHAFWLNLVDGFLSKMTRQMLRRIRVKTKKELVNRIYKYFDEINEGPVVYHWTGIWMTLTSTKR